MVSRHISDTDECKTGVCHKYAVCKNTAGSYQCHCKQGYYGDGFKCFRSMFVYEMSLLILICTCMFRHSNENEAVIFDSKYYSLIWRGTMLNILFLATF